MIFNKLNKFKTLVSGISVLASLYLSSGSFADDTSKDNLNRTVLAEFSGSTLYQNSDVWNYLGLPSTLFDNDNENNEIAKEGAKLELVEGHPFLTVNYNDSSTKDVKSYPFHLEEKRFSEILSYLSMLDSQARTESEQNKRNWSNSGQLGLTREGLELLVAHEHDLDKRVSLFGNVSVSKDTKTLIAGVENKLDGRTMQGNVFYSDGEDIDSQEFVEYGVGGKDIDFKKGNAQIYRLANRELNIKNEDSQQRIKYGFLTMGDEFLKGFSVNYEEGSSDKFGGRVYLGLIDNRAYKDNALLSGAKQIQNYDSTKKTGNHPVLSKGIRTQASIGYEWGHPNFEITQKLIGDWFGVFAGTGTKWHDYSHHVGLIVQPDNGYPGVSFSISDADSSDHNFFYQIISPEVKTLDFKSKFY